MVFDCLDIVGVVSVCLLVAGLLFYGLIHGLVVYL